MNRAAPDDALSALRELMEDFFTKEGAQFCWLYQEDIAIHDINPDLDRRIRALLDGAPEPQRPEWLPIETAPHDGTPIWAYQRVNKRQVPMKWKQGDGYAMWVYDDEYLQDVCPDPEPPSHYRLLPEPPKEAS